MGRSDYSIFSGGRIAGLDLKNRLVRSATYEASMTLAGKTTPAMLRMYRELAEGGVGLIITGHMGVARAGKSMARQICIWDDSYISEVTRLARLVHESGNGCKIVGQLNHGGRQVMQDNFRGKALGPSAVPSPLLRKKCRALSTSEVEKLIGNFAAGIVRLKKAGLDGAQLHAGHGWLLSSFLSPYTNKRTDRYGGSVENRVNIIRDIVQEARHEVGDFPILAKVNCDDLVPGGIDRASFPGLAREIERAGIDAIEVSGGMWDCLVRSEEELGFPPMPIPEARTRISSPERQSYFAEYAEELDLSIPVILVGGNRNVERLEKIMEGGRIQFFALSRPLLCEPDLPRRWLEGGAAGSACSSSNACLLTAKFAHTSCLQNGNKILYRSVKSLYPRMWRLVVK